MINFEGEIDATEERTRGDPMAHNYRRAGRWKMTLGGRHKFRWTYCHYCTQNVIFKKRIVNAPRVLSTGPGHGGRPTAY